MIPVDSSEARELREADAAQVEADHAAEVLHASVCRGSLLGVTADERPVPCPVCRPHLYAGPCQTCSVPRIHCELLGGHIRRRCCDACHHVPAPTLEACLDRVHRPIPAYSSGSAPDETAGQHRRTPLAPAEGLEATR